MLPGKFTYPFRYVPHPLIVDEAKRLCKTLDPAVFGEGKMIGVLLVRRKDGEIGFIRAFSGLAGGRSHIEGFAPPIFDWANPNGYFRAEEARISSLSDDDPAKGKASAALQDYLFSNYIVNNALGESISIKDIFAERGLIPPGGTGDCAAPKMLQQAYSEGATPLAMGEFWFGKSPDKEVREQGRFYPSCTGKCGPLLTWMMNGLDVETDPLDKPYLLEEPEVVFEDDWLIVANKPSGMLSVPGRTHSLSLLEWLRQRFGEAVESCHRLDMDTSGLIIYTKSLEAKIAMEKLFSSRNVVKKYRARLEASGVPFTRRKSGTITLPLCLDYYDRPRQIVDRVDGKVAITEYRVVEMLPNGEIEVEFTPKTGRTHQLRVHSAHKSGLARPIKGDRLYGSASDCRLCLNASYLSFVHPFTGEVMEFGENL